MIQVRVRLFATLRDGAGWAQRDWSLVEGATVETLLGELDREVDGLEVVGRPVYAAVNQNYVERTTLLQDGDEVALFPPVSGGTLVKGFAGLAKRVGG